MPSITGGRLVRETHQKLDGVEWLKRVRLCGVVRRETDQDGQCRTVISSYGSEDDLILRHDAPENQLAQMEALLVMVSKKCAFIGAAWKIEDWRPVARRLYFPGRTKQEFLAFLNAAAKAGYLEPVGADMDCLLTRQGLELVQQAQTKPRHSKQAFVAMWFDHRLNTAYKDGFFPALDACGYRPYRVDGDAQDARIDDLIFAEIRKSRFMVADLTGLRPNVFYEAGFARGLGIPVVLTCKDSDDPSDAPRPFSCPSRKRRSTRSGDRELPSTGPPPRERRGRVAVPAGAECTTGSSRAHYSRHARPVTQRLRRPPRVPMMQTANDRKFDHLTCFGRLHRSRFGRILAERKMGPAGMIVLVDEPPKQSPQMPLVHHDHMVE
jgi:hypothetical protein